MTDLIIDAVVMKKNYSFLLAQVWYMWHRGLVACKLKILEIEFDKNTRGRLIERIIRILKENNEILIKKMYTIASSRYTK